MRSSGVLMHISSLPSPYGIGTMGKEARKIVDLNQVRNTGRSFQSVRPAMVIHHISHFPVLQEILILSILRFYARKNC